MVLMQSTTTLQGSSGQWFFCSALPHCYGAVGNTTLVVHRHTAREKWVVVFLQSTTILLGSNV